MTEPKSDIYAQLRRIEGKVNKVIYTMIFVAVFYVAEWVQDALKSNQVSHWVAHGAFLGVALLGYFLLADFFGLRKSN